MASLLAALVGVVVVLKTPDAAWPWPHTLPDVLALMGGFCFALTNVMLRRLSDAPPACSISEVVFSSGSALWLGAGQLTPRVVFGGACILAAALWSALPGRPRLGPADTPESEPVSGSASAPSAFELAPCLLFVRGLGHYRRHSAHALWSIKNRSMQCYWPGAIVGVHTQ